MLRIRIKDIPAEGLKLVKDISAGAWKLDTESINFKVPIRVSLELRRYESSIAASADIIAIGQAQCDRCLEVFEFKLEKTAEFHFDIQDKEEIDLGDAVREELVLNLPAKLLCDTICKGLCAQCGANLNKQKCNHSKNQTKTTKLAALLGGKDNAITKT